MSNTLYACFAICFLAFSCEPYPRPPDIDCFSACYAAMTGADNCQFFIEQEIRSLDAYRHSSDVDGDVLCDALYGWWFKVIDTDGRGWWTDDFGRNVTGLTHFYASVVEIGSPHWGQNAYTHELAHIYDEYVGLYDDSSPHKDWEKRGIYTAIEKTRYNEE